MHENFELTSVEQRIYEKAAIHKKPIYGGFELTPYCNLSCKMCYVHETKSGLCVLDGEQWVEFGRQATEAGNLCVVLTGGEPLLHPEFRKIYTGLKKQGIILTINTNATLVDEDMADFLMEDMPRRVNVSLYGSNAEVYQKLCGNADGFSKTICAIELMLKRNIPVKINITPNKINYPYLDEMLSICKNYDLVVEMSPYLFEPIRKNESLKQLYRLTPEQMALAKIKWDEYRYNEYEMLTRAILCYQGLAEFENSRQIEGNTSLRCRAGNSSFWLCWNGKMNACVNMIRPQADVRELGFARAWEEVKKEGSKILVPAKCSVCSLRMFCNTCAAIGFHQNGKFEEVPEIMCQATEHYAKLLAQTVKKVEKVPKE